MRPRARARFRQLLLTSMAASACTSMRVQTDPLPEAIPEPEKEVRLSLRSGRDVTLFDARVERDSVIGFDRPHNEVDPQRIAIPIRDVEVVAVRRGDTFKTVLAVAGGVLAASTLVLLAACASLASA